MSWNKEINWKVFLTLLFWIRGLIRVIFGKGRMMIDTALINTEEIL